jgi:hypothetical protein
LLPRSGSSEDEVEGEDEGGTVFYKEDTSSSDARYGKKKWSSPERGRRAAEGKLNGLIKHLQKQNRIVQSKENNRNKGSEVISFSDAKSRASRKRPRVHKAEEKGQSHEDFRLEDSCENESQLDQETKDLFAQVWPSMFILLILVLTMFHDAGGHGARNESEPRP